MLIDDTHQESLLYMMIVEECLNVQQVESMFLELIHGLNHHGHKLVVYMCHLLEMFSVSGHGFPECCHLLT